MNKKQIITMIIALIITITTIAIVSASPLQDILSDEATGMEIRISQNFTLVEFYLDTHWYDWDDQDMTVSFEGQDITINQVPISTILMGVNFEYSTEDLRQEYPEFSSIELDCDDPWISAIFSLVSSSLELDYSCEFINENSSDFIELMKEYFPPESIVGNSYMNKQGIDYEMWFDGGFGDIPEEYDENIEQILIQNIHIFNLQNLFGTGSEDFTFTFDLLDELDYNASIDLGGLNLSQNGVYEIEMIASANGETYSKIITVKIVDVPEPEPEPEEDEEEEENDGGDGNKRGGSRGGGGSHIYIAPNISISDEDDEDKPDEPIDIKKAPTVDLKSEPKQERNWIPIIIGLVIGITILAVSIVIVITIRKSKFKAPQVHNGDEKLEDEGE